MRSSDMKIVLDILTPVQRSQRKRRRCTSSSTKWRRIYVRITSRKFYNFATDRPPFPSTAIFLAQFKCSHNELLRGVMELNDELLDAAQVKELAGFVPSSNDVR